MISVARSGPEAASIRADPASTPTSASMDAASVRHLLERVAVIEARVRVTVAARRARDPDGDDRFRGLYVSDEQADRLLITEAARAPGAADPGVEARLATAERRADMDEHAGEILRLRRLSHAFGLLPLDLELLLVALAPDLEPRLERLYGYLNDDVTRRRASIGLALELCGVPIVSGIGRARLRDGAPLIDGGLMVVEDPERPFLTRALRVPDRVTAHLLGDDRPDPVVAPLMARAAFAGSDDPAADALRRGLEAGITLVYLRERPGGDARAIAGAIPGPAGEDGDDRPCILDLDRLADHADPAVVGAAAERETRLADRLFVAGPLDHLASRGSEAIRAFLGPPSQARAVRVLHGRAAWDPAWSTEVPLVLDVSPTCNARRATWWREALGDTPGAAEAVVGVESFPFRLGRDQIRRAATSARLASTAEGREIRTTDLAAGVRSANAVGLERLARRVEPSADWGDLVLPPGVLEQLRELTDRARFREAVLEGWRLGEASRGRGLTALFAGDSGTGKTLSAEIVAGALGMELHVIDLAGIVDKYVGETEKNLDRVFDQADGVNAILLFDEADALFGKRSEVRDAHDRYANIETAYLLQRMERFDGLAILTTNLRANIDEAFTRRLEVLIDFPLPDIEQRGRLWRRHLRPTVPVAADIDLDFLAARFRLSGGNVRNIVVAAAHRAAARGGPVSMTDLIHSTDREYRKLGHLSTEAEFGPWFAALSG